MSTESKKSKTCKTCKKPKNPLSDKPNGTRYVTHVMKHMTSTDGTSIYKYSYLEKIDNDNYNKSESTQTNPITLYKQGDYLDEHGHVLDTQAGG